MKHYLIGLLSLALLVSCSSTKKDDLKSKTPDELYKRARAHLRTGQFTDAAEDFKEIDTLFSYSARADEAHVLSAYAYFRAASYVDALRELDIFLRYHPTHALVPYAKYLHAMCVYMQMSSVGRDQKAAADARSEFLQVMNEFPDSIYAADCAKKIKMIDNIIAAHEMVIGRYYQNNNNILAAIGRYNYVVKRMSDTAYAEEACYRVIECCHSAGLIKEAQNAYDLIKLRFPNGKWYKKASALMGKGFVIRNTKNKK